MLVIEAKGVLQENNITTYNIDHIQYLLDQPIHLYCKAIRHQKDLYAKYDTNQGTFNTL